MPPRRPQARAPPALTCASPPNGVHPLHLPLRAHTCDPQIPSERIVGAALVGPSSAQVWHVEPVKGSERCSSGPSVRLLKSQPFDCGSGQDAAKLVEETRRACCWYAWQGGLALRAWFALHKRPAAGLHALHACCMCSRALLTRAVLQCICPLRTHRWGLGRPPRVYAIINPVSGRGRSLQMFRSELLPVLEDAAGMEVVLHTTRGPGHAAELLGQLDLASVDLLVFVGGDGTVYEGVQVRVPGASVGRQG